MMIINSTGEVVAGQPEGVCGVGQVGGAAEEGGRAAGGGGAGLARETGMALGRFTKRLRNLRVRIHATLDIFI